MRSGKLRKDDAWDVAFELWALVHGYVALYRAGRIDLSEKKFRALCRRSLERLIDGLLLLARSVSGEWNDLLGALASANWVLLVPAICLYFCGAWLRSMRWGLLLPGQNLRTTTLFMALVIGFTVNNLLPGYTRTERVESLAMTTAKKEGIDAMTVLKRFERDVPMKRLGDPSEFAALAAFLASERASYITAQSIAVDGGWIRALM